MVVRGAGMRVHAKCEGRCCVAGTDKKTMPVADESRLPNMSNSKQLCLHAQLHSQCTGLAPPCAPTHTPSLTFLVSGHEENSSRVSLLQLLLSRRPREPSVLPELERDDSLLSEVRATCGAVQGGGGKQAAQPESALCKQNLAQERIPQAQHVLAEA